jgi:hypothetical protein
MMQNAVSKLFSQSKWLILLLVLGTLSWSLTMAKSGLIYPEYGMGFWGPNGRDGVWHISLSRSLSQGSLEMPNFAGERIKNYHIGFDLFLAGIHSLTGIPLLHLYFQILPPLIALSIGILTYIFVYRWKKSKSAALWSTFFVYFGGSFGWIVTLLRSGNIGGESVFWSQQAISTLVNPPLALSWVFILLTLVLLQSRKNIVVTAVVASLILQTKAYGGALFLPALLAVALFQVVLKKDSYFIKVFILTFILSLILFIPLNGGSTGFLIFQPFWFLETMMSYTDRFGWTKFYDAMVNYRASNNWLKAMLAYGLAFAIFWFGNIGTRSIKEIEVIRWLRHPKRMTWVEVFITLIIIGGLVSTLLFVQRGTPWNIIQFLYYALLFSGILAGVAASDFTQKFSPKARVLSYLVLVLLTIPTTLSTLWWSYLPARPPAKLSFEEMDALQFLAGQPKGIVLKYPFDSAKSEEAKTNPPRPLYLYDTDAYISAFSGKSVYLEDSINADITGFDAVGRYQEEMKFYNTLNEVEARKFLHDNSITYLYWVKPQRARLGDKQLGLERIFENKEVDIWKVIK